MFWFCLRRRLRVACSHRGSDCAYGAARIVVQLPSRVVRRRARLRHSTANHRQSGLEPNDLRDVLRVANAAGSSTVSAGSAQ